MSEELYRCSSQGLAAFLLFVLSEDAYSHISLNEKQRPLIWFHDRTAGNSCSELATLYNSGQAMLRDAREYSNCWEMIGHEIRTAYRAAKT